MAKAAIIVVIVLAVLWAVIGGNNKPKLPKEDIGQTPIMIVEKMEPIMVTLLPMNKSGESGVAEISTDGVKTKVVIRITNNTSSVAQPAHIHVGMCPAPGAVEFPLNDVIGGLSETILDVPFNELLRNKKLAINIHKSISESAIYASCGDFPQ